MSLIGYVRQVRPIQESHVNHLDKVQSLLTEASSGIKYDDLWKRDNLERFISSTLKKWRCTII